MKRILTFALALTMVLAVAAPAMAEGNLFSVSNGWYYEADADGTLTVSDNKVTYIFDVIAGENFLGLQNDYTGQLAFVGFEAAHVCEFVKSLVGAEVAVSIENVIGNTNPYTFVITEEFSWVCECGETLDNTFEDSTYVIYLDNNFVGEVEVGDYLVFIDSYGNVNVRDLYIV
jgi:hypothetical protein